MSTMAQRIKVDGVLHLLEKMNKKKIKQINGETEVLLAPEYAGYHLVQQQNEGRLLVSKIVLEKV